MLDTAIKIVHGHDCESLTADSNGEIIDTKGWDEALLIVNIGVIAATGTIDVTVEEDALVAFASGTDISGAVFDQVLTAGDQISMFCRIRIESPRERFFRCVMDQGTAAVLISATWVLLRPHSSVLKSDPEFDV